MSGIAFRFILVALVASASLWFSPARSAENGVSDSEILIGQSCQLTGPLAPLSEELNQGARLYVDHINAAGGVNGRRIKVLTLDDAYDPKRTADNAKRLVEHDRVFALFNFTGTPTTLAALPIVERDGVPLLAPFTGTDAVRTKPSRYVFNVRAGYADEIEEMVQHLTTVGITSIGVAYLDNAFGKSSLEAVRAAMKKRGASVAAAVAFGVNGNDLPAAVEAMKKANPPAIILATAGKSTSDFIGAYQKAAATAQFYALSVVSSQQLTKALGEASRGVVISQVMPFPWSRGSPIVREFQEMAAAKGIKNVTYNHMEGFVSARVLVEGLRRAGRNLTRDALIRGLESMRNADVGGFLIDFSEGRHNGSRFVDLTIVGRGGTVMR